MTKTALQEREAIVTWLEAKAKEENPSGLVDSYFSQWALKYAANAIERRDHHKGKEQI